MLIPSRIVKYGISISVTSVCDIIDGSYSLCCCLLYGCWSKHNLESSLHVMHYWPNRQLEISTVYQTFIKNHRQSPRNPHTVYPKKYAHGFVVLCFVVVMQSFIMNSYEVFIHIHQGCFAGTGAIVRLPQCQWSKPDWYGRISQCITTTKHSKAKTVCIFLGIYCSRHLSAVRTVRENCAIV